jgi:hypothetical protein
MPKNNTTFFGSAQKELAFVQITDVDYKLEAPDLAPTGLVTVAGAHVTT